MSRPWKRFRGGSRRSNNPNKSSASNPRPAGSGSSDQDPDEEEDTGLNNDNGELKIEDDDPSLNVKAIDKESNLPFYGCKLYFNTEDISKDIVLVKKVRIAESFFVRNIHIPASISHEGPSFNVNAEDIFSDEEFMEEWDSFKEDLQDSPVETLNCLGLALHQVIIQMPTEKPRKELNTLRVKIFNYRPLISSSDIKVNSYGKLIATRGCVIRVSRAKQVAQWFVFACISCKAQTVVKQPNGIYTSPKKCTKCGRCKFEPKLASPYVVAVTVQVIKLQEHLDALKDDRGKMPRILEVELFDDLVDSCAPGDDVTVVGIVKVRGTDDGIIKSKVVSSNALYLEAVSIVDNKNKSQKQNASGVDLNNNDLIAIRKIHDDPHVLPLLVRSLCPAIYGHEMIKAGLLLSLFGGSGTQTCRNDIHVLMVGDPGLGKSQMLHACTRIASQSVYVCGNASTSSGLTVTLSKESGTTDFALEPGALVLADKGTCVIDEFDKMPIQHQALLEAMEQQSVSVAKGGIICSLEARTSILAAANPIGGRYDVTKSVIDNLNLSQPLLSRFDLIFLLLDRPDEEHDSMMCAHVMKAHKGGFKRMKQNLNNSDCSGNYCTLQDRLSAGNDCNVVPQIMLRKYVAYARQYVKPKLTDGAAEVLKSYYLKLRESTNLFGSLPVFHRQLEALIRLTQARAKLELRIEAHKKDAQDIVDLFNYMLSSVPELKYIQSRSDSGKITVNKVRAFIRLLKDEVKSGVTQFSKTDLNEIAIQGGISIEDFHRFIQKLNEEGVLLKRGPNTYEFVGV